MDCRAEASAAGGTFGATRAATRRDGAVMAQGWPFAGHALTSWTLWLAGSFDAWRRDHRTSRAPLRERAKRLHSWLD